MSYLIIQAVSYLIIQIVRYIIQVHYQEKDVLLAWKLVERFELYAGDVVIYVLHMYVRARRPKAGS